MRVLAYYDNEPCDDSIRMFVCLTKKDFEVRRLIDTHGPPPLELDQHLTRFIKKFSNLYKTSTVTPSGPVEELKDIFAVAVVYKNSLRTPLTMNGIMQIDDIMPTIFDAYNLSPQTADEKVLLEVSLCFAEKNSVALQELKRQAPTKYNETRLNKRKPGVMKMCDMADKFTFVNLN